MGESRKILTLKKVQLKNGQTVKLEFYHYSDLYSIYAIDKENDIVGILSFEILHQYKCVISEEERQKEAKMRNISPFLLKNEYQKFVFESSLHLYDIHDGVLTEDGRKYALSKSTIILDLIEIKDEKFFQVGLGSAMHKEMESFAQEKGCDEIRLSLYHPFGEFQNATRSFYEHSGYVFEQDNGSILVHKDLHKESSENKKPDSHNCHLGKKLLPIHKKE